MRTGRPTLYNESILAKTNEYLNIACPENMSIPTIEGLSLALGVDDDTIVEWAKKYPVFSAATKRVMVTQKVHLINTGMFGGKEVNAAMAIFLLKNNHNMKDRTDVTTNDKDLPAPLLGGITKTPEDYGKNTDE